MRTTALDRLWRPPQSARFFQRDVLDERDGETGVMTLAISKDQKIIAHALKSTAQVGLTALCVLQHVFKEKFELLGIRQEIDALKTSGML